MPEYTFRIELRIVNTFFVMLNLALKSPTICPWTSNRSMSNFQFNLIFHFVKCIQQQWFLSMKFVEKKKDFWTVIKSNVQFRVNSLDIVVTTISACGSWAQRQVVSHTHNNAKKKKSGSQDWEARNSSGVVLVFHAEHENDCDFVSMLCWNRLNKKTTVCCSAEKQILTKWWCRKGLRENTYMSWPCGC